MQYDVFCHIFNTYLSIIYYLLDIVSRHYICITYISLCITHYKFLSHYILFITPNIVYIWSVSCIQLDWPWTVEWAYAGIFAVAVRIQNQGQFCISHKKNQGSFLFSKSQKMSSYRLVWPCLIIACFKKLNPFRRSNSQF